MASLEELIGPGYENLSNEELEKIIMTGRVAREAEMEGARVKRSGGKKAAGPKKSSIPTFELDLDLDLEDDDAPEVQLDI